MIIFIFGINSWRLKSQLMVDKDVCC